MTWKRWLTEDLSSRPLQWLRSDLVPPAPYLVCDPKQTPGGSGTLVQPSPIDAQFRKAWMPFFRRGEIDPVPLMLSRILLVAIFCRRRNLTSLSSLVKIYMLQC